MSKRIKNLINIFLELGKVRITFFVAISTSMGYVLYSNELDWNMALVGFGVFVLAVASSALNHYQERDTDALMDRTKGRPIPAGKIKPGNVLLFFLIAGSAGLFIVYSIGGLFAFFLGILALIWYNVIYTPMKKKYAMAVVPGSLIGAIPPMIGWVSAGGGLNNHEIQAFALFFFIWQIPHFWLLLLIYGKDYEKAGFPTLTGVFSSKQLSRITFVWISALAVSSLLIPLFSISKSYYSLAALIIASIYLLFKSREILKPVLEKTRIRKMFLVVNLFVLIVVAVISVEKLIL
ncbi:MAG: protoheme IX farnesyltransferase [Bacteroidetes bacterium]|nr:protoheme IX farnesyltransferase [Bacteroidota bacterium]